LEYPRPRTVKLTKDSGWESDKHPSYSPDGRQIVFASNRTGKKQLWVMDSDGGNLRRLLDIDADCWDPVWIR
jgi:TolB protein